MDWFKEGGSCSPEPSGKVVLKLSGSLVYPPRGGYLAALKKVVGEMVADMGCKVGIVVGGGGLAKAAISELRPLGLNESALDLIGIEASRFNASVVAIALKPLTPSKPQASLLEAEEALAKGLVPVMGGLQPGQSTNAVASLLAEFMGASTVLNALNGVKGVYSDEPGREGARLLKKISYSDMRSLIERFESAAGKYTLWDRVALDVVERSGIRVIFFDGSDPHNILRALEGSIGTVMGV